MAALQTIRGRAGLLVTVLGVALLAFILSDFFTSGNALFSKIKDNAFSVDGDVISTGAFMSRADEWETFNKILSNQSSLDEGQRVELREQLYQQMVEEMTLGKEAEVLGLSVSTEELNDMVYGDNISPLLYSLPIFANPQTRQFDRTALTNFLEVIKQNTDELQTDQAAEINTYKQLWITIEKLLKSYRLKEKYNSLVAGTVLVTDLEKNALIEAGKKEANISYVTQAYITIADADVELTDGEIEQLYNKRKNNFKLDSDLRKISYFVKDVLPSNDDYAAIEKEMEEGIIRLRDSSNPAMVVNGFSGNQYIDAFTAITGLPEVVKIFVNAADNGDVYGPVREGEDYIMYKMVEKSLSPDSTQMSLIVFPREFDATAIGHIADSLVNVITTEAKFAEEANKFMPNSNGGDMGMLDEMTLARFGLSKECLAAKPGTVVKTQIAGQTALVRVNAKSAPIQRVKLATIEMPVLISDKTQNGVDNELSQFVSKFGNLETFNEAARNQGYSLVDNAMIHRADFSLSNVENTRNIVQWTYTEGIGAVKKFDFTNKRIVAIVTDEITGDYLPINEVKDALKAELIRDKKAEKIIASINANKKSSLEDYAIALNTEVKELNAVAFNTNQLTNLGYEPIINAYAKTASSEELVGPLKGLQGVYILSQSSEQLSIDMDADVAETRLNQMNYSQLVRSAPAVLQTKMNVKDNRVNFW